MHLLSVVASARSPSLACVCMLSPTARRGERRPRCSHGSPPLSSSSPSPSPSSHIYLHHTRPRRQLRCRPPQQLLGVWALHGCSGFVFVLFLFCFFPVSFPTLTSTCLQPAGPRGPRSLRYVHTSSSSAPFPPAPPAADPVRVEVCAPPRELSFVHQTSSELARGGGSV